MLQGFSPFTKVIESRKKSAGDRSLLSEAGTIWSRKVEIRRGNESRIIYSPIDGAHLGQDAILSVRP